MSSSTFEESPALELSIGEKLGVALITLDAMRRSLQQWVVATLFTPAPTSPPKDVLVQTALVRCIFARASWRQQKTLSPTTSTVYKEWIEQPAQKKLGYEYTVEDLASDPGGSAAVQTRLLWIGKPWQRGDGDGRAKKDEKKVVLYLHGGGFVMSMCKSQVQWMAFLKEEAKRAHGYDVSVAIVEYSTAPHKQFPTQFHQCVLALNHLLAAGCPPSNIALIGDSAGGHAALSILSHILHPYPGVTPVRPLATPLACAILCSPWVCMATNAQSFLDYESVDYIPPSIMPVFGELSMGAGTTQREAAAGRFHSEALTAPESWWHGLRDVVGFVGITAGACEVMVDHIGQIATKIGAESGAPVDYFAAPREVHDQPIIDFEAGRPASAVTLKMSQWLGERLNA